MTSTALKLVHGATGRHPSFPADSHQFHLSLSRFNSQRLRPAKPSPHWELGLQEALEFQVIEGHYVEQARQEIAGLLPSRSVNGEPLADSFVRWFEGLQDSGPGQNHRLFRWLAECCDAAQMKWFLTQEAAGEAGFEDLLACTQVKLSTRPKLECARNYWDEMGHGRENAMHGTLLAVMVRDLDLHPSPETSVWEALAQSNTMIALAMNRRYAYQSLGALGVIELTAPARVRQVACGMRRLGFAPQTRAYFDLHGALDLSHSRAWIREIIRPLVDADPSCAGYIAEGALMRLNCGMRCFDRYWAQFDDDTAVAARSLAPAGEQTLPV